MQTNPKFKKKNTNSEQEVLRAKTPGHRSPFDQKQSVKMIVPCVYRISPRTHILRCNAQHLKNKPLKQGSRSTHSSTPQTRIL
jgi:hypothetical protein